MHFDDPDMSAGDTAIGYTDDFVDAAVKKLDATFGKGYAKANPAAMAGYLQSCSNALGAFMTAATAMQSDGMADLMAAALDEMEDDPDFALPGSDKSKRK